MSHTYATVDQYKMYQWGSSSPGTANDSSILLLLEASSRRVDGFLSRSPSGQSFLGPRIGTNTYDAQGWYGGYTLYRDNMVMDLDDDLIGISSATVLDQTGGTATAITEGTDFYLQPYNKSPKRTLVITGLGQSYIVPGLKILAMAGTWGYSATTATLGTLALASSSATAGTLTAGSASIGMMLLAGTEQLYVQAATGGTALMLARGQNGTTAAAGTGAASYYTYPAEAVDATLRIAQRRWKMREAGLTGDMGGIDVPVAGFRDTETSILRSTINHLRVMAIG